MQPWTEALLKRLFSGSVHTGDYEIRLCLCLSSSITCINATTSTGLFGDLDYSSFKTYVTVYMYIK